MNATSIAHVSVLLATFIVATTFPVGAIIAPHLDPGATVFTRFLISIITMLPIALFTNLISIPSAKRLMQYASVGLVHAGFFILMFVALRYTTSLNTAVIYSLTPSISAIVAFLLIGERVNRIHFFLLPAAVLATIWVIFQGNVQKILDFNLNLGDSLFGLGCILLGLYSTLLKKLHVKGRTLDLVFWSMTSAAVPLAVYTLTATSISAYWDVPQQVYGWIIYLSVLTVLTSFIWAYGTPTIGPMKTMAYSYLVPTFVLFINGVAYGAWPNAATIPGVLIGLICMIFIQVATVKGSVGGPADKVMTEKSNDVALSRK